jgi:hypothetical protein
MFFIFSVELQQEQFASEHLVPSVEQQIHCLEAHPGHSESQEEEALKEDIPSNWRWRGGITFI